MVDEAVEPLRELLRIVVHSERRDRFGRYRPCRHRRKVVDFLHFGTEHLPDILGHHVVNGVDEHNLAFKPGGHYVGTFLLRPIVLVVKYARPALAYKPCTVPYDVEKLRLGPVCRAARPELRLEAAEGPAAHPPEHTRDAAAVVRAEEPQSLPYLCAGVAFEAFIPAH